MILSLGTYITKYLAIQKSGVTLDTFNDILFLISIFQDHETEIILLPHIVDPSKYYLDAFYIKSVNLAVYVIFVTILIVLFLLLIGTQLTTK